MRDRLLQHISKARDYFEAGKLDFAIRSTSDCISLARELYPRNMDLHSLNNELSLFKARFKNHQNSVNSGIHSAEFILTERNQLLKSMIDLIDKSDKILIQLDDTPANIPIKPSYNKPTADLNIINKLSEFFNVSEEAGTLLFHLVHHKFEWRNEATLCKKTGWSSEKINTLANRYPKLIKISRGKSGNIIYKIENRFMPDARRIVNS